MMRHSSDKDVLIRRHSALLTAEHNVLSTSGYWVVDYGDILTLYHSCAVIVLLEDRLVWMVPQSIFVTKSDSNVKSQITHH